MKDRIRRALGRVTHALDVDHERAVAAGWRLLPRWPVIVALAGALVALAIIAGGWRTERDHARTQLASVQAVTIQQTATPTLTRATCPRSTLVAVVCPPSNPCPSSSGGCGGGQQPVQGETAISTDSGCARWGAHELCTLPRSALVTFREESSPTTPEAGSAVPLGWGRSSFARLLNASLSFATSYRLPAGLRNVPVKDVKIGELALYLHGPTEHIGVDPAGNFVIAATKERQP